MLEIHQMPQAREHLVRALQLNADYPRAVVAMASLAA
jgi:hypothetical protein